MGDELGIVLTWYVIQNSLYDILSSCLIRPCKESRYDIAMALNTFTPPMVPQ